MTAGSGDPQLHASHKTYRVRRIPSHLDALRLVRLLVELDPRLGPSDGVKVMSLAHDLGPYASTKVSTIMFDKTPRCFTVDKDEWVFPHVGMEQDLLIDVHFRGLTVLNEVGISDTTVDCIAISGLGGHPFGSWRSRDAHFMWLRDQLHKDASNLRTILWGYDTQLLYSQSLQSIEELAAQFVDLLSSAFGSDHAPAPRILFLAHSLGGIILKQALIYLADGDEFHKSIVTRIIGIINFGVPAKGMRVSSLRTMVKGQPNADLINRLEEDADHLAQLQQRYRETSSLKRIRIKSVYETKLSATAIEIEAGVWERQGPFETLVKQDSAIHPDSPREDVIPINEDHYRLVKFSSGDENCTLIVKHIKDLASAVRTDQSREPAENSKNDGRKPSWTGSVSIQRTEPGSLQHLRWLYHIQFSDGGGQLFNEADISERIQAIMQWQFVNQGVHASFQNIAEADSSTFEWVFENTALHFKQWLRDCQGIFWIQGKPGSGKSTLMRFILNHEDLQHILSVNEGDVRICTSFFFDERSDSAQQSFKGVVSAIVGTLIQKENCFREIVERTFLEMALGTMPFTPVPAWNMAWLRKLVARLLQQNEAPARIYLFLDALDEYNEDKTAISDFLNEMVALADSSPKTKLGVCISSRPWPIFEKKFSRWPGFSIHEHTRQDIRHFTQARLQDLDRLLNLTNMADDRDQVLPDIVSHIATKSAGVFLWVVIVVRELGLAMAEGITEFRMLEILEDLPNELENLYDLALARVDPKYRLESYIMFEVMLRADGDASLRDFVCAVHCAKLETAEKCILSFNRTSSLMSYKDSLDNEIRQIKSRCGGLIETKGESRVQFMHQTAKDYLLKPGVLQKRLGHHAVLGGQNGYSFWSKLELVSIHQRYEGNAWLKFEKNTHVWSTLQQAEATSGQTQSKFLDSIFQDDVLKSVYFNEIVSTHSCWISFAWTARLELYMLDVARKELKTGQWPRKSRLQLISDTIKFAGIMRQATHANEVQRPSGLLKKLAQELLKSGAETNASGHDTSTPLDGIIMTARDYSRYLRNWQMEDVCDAISFMRARGAAITNACDEARDLLSRRNRLIGLATYDWMKVETPESNTAHAVKDLSLRARPSMRRAVIKLFSARGS